MSVHLASFIFYKKSDLSMVIRERSFILIICNYIYVIGSWDKEFWLD